MLPRLVPEALHSLHLGTLHDNDEVAMVARASRLTHLAIDRMDMWEYFGAGQTTAAVAQALSLSLSLLASSLPRLVSFGLPCLCFPNGGDYKKFMCPSEVVDHFYAPARLFGETLRVVRLPHTMSRARSWHVVAPCVLRHLPPSVATVVLLGSPDRILSRDAFAAHVAGLPAATSDDLQYVGDSDE